jgi:DNA mismatch endonuclease (patch repair protein)
LAPEELQQDNSPLPMDTVSKEKRSEIMSKIRGKDTKPEKIVRSLLHSMGYRFRLHRKDLPGKPDIVLPKYKTVIFVHGCFWHRHEGCKFSTMPGSHIPFWKSKFENTIRRDMRSTIELEKMKWNVIVVWECQTKKQDSLIKSLQEKITHG